MHHYHFWYPQNCYPYGSHNAFIHFIGPNPRTSFNPYMRYPCIHPTTFVGPFSTVIGDITLGANVFIAPNASLRADEGTPFYVGANTNIQDGVILHGLKDKKVIKNHNYYSIYIGEGVTCAHGCLIHGPCLVGDNVFVGFNAIIFNAIIGAGSFISTNAVVTDGVCLSPNSFVPLGAVIDNQAKADALGQVSEDQKDFAEEVQHVNHEFPATYAVTFGTSRCSCGMACNNVQAVLV